MHYIKSRKKGKKGYVALKLDISKAFERVAWDFLEGMMNKLGFHHEFINMILMYLEGVRVRVRVRINDSMTDAFEPQRGLKQGDSPSPYKIKIALIILV